MRYFQMKKLLEKRLVCSTIVEHEHNIWGNCAAWELCPSLPVPAVGRRGRERPVSAAGCSGHSRTASTSGTRRAQFANSLATCPEEMATHHFSVVVTSLLWLNMNPSGFWQPQDTMLSSRAWFLRTSQHSHRDRAQTSVSYLEDPRDVWVGPQEVWGLGAG